MRLHLSILCAACALTFFLGLGRAAISDSDEAFYAEAGREMVVSGDLITPRYNFEPRFQKPILYYWFVAAAYGVAGVGELAARFPAALAGFGLTLVTWALGRRWYDANTGLAAGLVAATNFGYYSIGRLALPDLPLAFFVTLSAWAGFEALRAGQSTDRAAGVSSDGARFRWLLLSAAGAALGMLMKGPVGPALWLLVLGPSLLIADGRVNWRRVRPGDPASAWPPPSQLAAAAGLFLVIAIPWYLAMVHVHGVAYLNRFFVGENLVRFATERYNEPRPIWFYLPIVAGGLMPWSPFLTLWIAPALRVLRRQRAVSTTEWWLLLWAAIPLVFYSLSIGKQPRYILPVLPPLAVLLARSIVVRVQAGDPTRGLAWCATASAVVLGLLGALLFRAHPMLIWLEPFWGVMASVGIVAAALGLVAAAWLAPPRHLVLALAAISALTLVMLQYAVYSGAGLEPVQRLAQHVKQHRDGIAEVGTYRVFVRNLVFYTGLKQVGLEDADEVATFLASPTPVLCVLPQAEVARLERGGSRHITRLAEVRYFNPAALRLRTLIRPDPARDLETVVLVTNR